jgi:hypothetical protein
MVMEYDRIVFIVAWERRIYPVAAEGSRISKVG